MLKCDGNSLSGVVESPKQLILKSIKSQES